MRILVVTHYFPPEIGAPQARLSEMTRYWAEAGEQVTVLTGMPNHPTGVIPPEYRGAIRRTEDRDGVRVLRSWVFATPNEGIIKKTLSHLSFMVSSVLLHVRSIGPIDVVVVSSPTFFSIFAAWAIAKLRRAALVVEIRDLWPAIFVELGVLTNPLAIQFLERLELWAYRAADAVVVVSEGFRDDLIRRGVPSGKVTTIRNGVDLDLFQLDRDPLPGRKRLGVGSDTTLVLYLGAHGISHGLETVVRAAQRLRDENVLFAFVGEGAMKSRLVALAAAQRACNVSFHEGVSRDEVPDLLAAADICLVPLRDVPLFSSFIPSKIFEYFGAGKAVVGSVAGEPLEILREGGATVVPPEDDRALADAVQALAGDAPRRAAMGATARRYVEEHFDRRALAERYRVLLSRTLSER